MPDMGSPVLGNWVKTHQLSNVLTELYIDAAVSKAQFLQPVCTPGMALALCLLILLPTQIPEAPLVVCATGKHGAITGLYDKHSMPFSQCWSSSSLVRPLQLWNTALKTIELQEISCATHKRRPLVEL